MWKNVDVDLERFRERYEDWLEEEVWTYYDWLKLKSRYKIVVPKHFFHSLKYFK